MGFWSEVRKEMVRLATELYFQRYIMRRSDFWEGYNPTNPEISELEELGLLDEVKPQAIRNVTRRYKYDIPKIMEIDSERKEDED